ncbi:MAG TPA: sugar kinase [Caulobacteraceae bacterium]
MTVDLSAEMAGLWGALDPQPAGRARLIQFASATPREGASTIAREFAFHAATRAERRVWLVDLDLMGSSQAATIAAEAERYGPLGPPSAASPTGAVFFTVQPPLRRPDGRPWADARYFAAHAVGAASFWVTRFRADALRGPQAVQIVPSGEYWQALRRHADLIVVDAPSAERSAASVTVARFMDETILVVAADQPEIGAPGRLRDAITAAGGRCSGLFLNRANLDAPAFLRTAV